MRQDGLHTRQRFRHYPSGPINARVHRAASVYTQHNAAANARDVARSASFWSDDAVLLFPGSPPVVGKNALLDYVADSFRIPTFPSPALEILSCMVLRDDSPVSRPD